MSRHGFPEPASQPLLNPDDEDEDEDNEDEQEPTQSHAATNNTMVDNTPTDHSAGKPNAKQIERRHGDAAAELLRSQGLSGDEPIVFTPDEGARVLRRIDLVILPLMLAVYFLQGLDKATLAYASVFGLIDDVGLVGDEFSWLGSVVYLAQLAMQFPLAWLLVKLPIGKFTSAMVLCWGITLAAMATARTFPTLLAARFFLGAFEASVAPSFVAITQMWWTRREQTMRTSYWYAMNGVTNMFGSLITYGLGHISSQLKAYQIIFLFFGLVTVAFSFVMAVFMPDSPVEARFLGSREKLIAVERLRMNQMGVMSREWKWDHFWETLRDPKTWFWFALAFSISVPSGGISTFGPLIVQSFGYNAFDTILFNIPFGAVQLVATLGGAYLAMRFHKKGPVIALLCLPPMVGCVLLMITTHDASHKVVLLAGYYLLSVYPGIPPLIYSWSAQNTGGDTKRKCTSAAVFIGQSVGNVIGPLLYTPAEAPEYRRGLQSNFALYGAMVVLVAAASIYLALLNRDHTRRRVAMGKSAVIVDTSMYSTEEAQRMRQRIAGSADAEMLESGVSATQDRLGERAFEDLTDLQNEEFLYVY